MFQSYGPYQVPRAYYYPSSWPSWKSVNGSLTPTRCCPKIGYLPQSGIKLMCQLFAGQSPDRYETVTRRLRLNGQSTSIRLERAFWHILDDIALREGISTPAFISKLHAEVLELHGEARNFTSLLRCVCTIHLEDGRSMRAVAAE